MFVEQNPWARSTEPDERVTQPLVRVLAANGLLPEETRARFVAKEINLVDASLDAGTLVSGPTLVLYTSENASDWKGRSEAK